MKPCLMIASYQDFRVLETQCAGYVEVSSEIHQNLPEKTQELEVMILAQNS